MSLTNSYWDAARKNSGVQETWLIKLWYDDESTGKYITLSDRNIIIDSDTYNGIVIDFGSITESIDLLKSSSSIGNIDVVVRNLWKNQPFAKELFGGTKYYINRKVDIYSRMGDTTTLSNCVQIYQGRLFNIIQENESVLTLQIEQKKPQDLISIPQNKTPKGTYIPVVYGDYTPNDTTQTNQDFCTSKALWPVPIEFNTGESLMGVAYQAIASEGRLHFYEKSADIFVPLSDGSSYRDVSVISYGFDSLLGGSGLIRGFKFKPIIDHENNSVSSPENTFDLIDDDSTYSTCATYSATAESTDTSKETSLLVKAGEVVGTISELLISVRYNLTFTGPGTGTAKIRNLTYGRTDLIENRSSGNSGNTLSSTIDMTTSYTANDNQMPDSISISSKADWSLGGTVTSTVKLYDIHLHVKASLDITNNPSDKKIQDDIKFLYCGADGFDKSYTGAASAVADDIHEIFRDILKRYAGFDESDANMEGWSSLDTDRTGWSARLWILDPISLDSILKRLQYEGGFIFKYKVNGGKFIHVEDSYDISNVIHTITINDIDDINLSLTDFSEVLTETTYNYEINPATNKYIGEVTYTNSSNRTNYWASIATEENKAKVDLKYLTDNPKATADINPNDSIALYYDNIYADPKILINFNIVNKEMFDLEIGDIIKFSSTDILPFGKTWSLLYFMITKTKRTLNGLTITAREVFEDVA